MGTKGCDIFAPFFGALTHMAEHLVFVMIPIVEESRIAVPFFATLFVIVIDAAEETRIGSASLFPGIIIVVHGTEKSWITMPCLTSGGA